jgi:hypothetical protein
LPDHLADGGLRRENDLRGLREATLPYDFDENSQLPQIEIYSHME